MFSNHSIGNSTNHLHYLDESVNVKMIKLYSVILYIVIITMCIVGNAVVVITILKTLGFRSTKNYFLRSSSLADMLIGIICMPSNFLMDNLDDSTFNVFLCKSIPFIQGVTKSSSVYSFTAIALERYVVITKPYGNRPQKRCCVIAIFMIWVSSAVLYSPKLFVNSIENRQGQYMCAEHGWSLVDSKRYIIIIIILTYIVPVIISTVAFGITMTYLWHRQVPGVQDLPDEMKKVLKRTLNRAKICRRMLRILLVFILLYLPSTVLTIFWYFGDDLDWKPPPYMWIVGFHAEIIKYANSALNPILFCVLDPAFRVAIRSCFTCKTINQSERAISLMHRRRSTSI